MSRKSGRVKRIVSRLFKERQIYHRSDGVVHFIAMSTNTQIALATVIGGFLLWVAYASVNVVFKEQIIVAKDRNARVMETTYQKQIHRQQQAYDDVSTLNVLLQQNFEETVAEISSRHQTLQAIVERKAGIDKQIDALSQNLSRAGAPNGARPVNGNRVMIDVSPVDATPRQSRLSVLRQEAAEEAKDDAPPAPPGSPAAAAIQKMESSAADLYVEQMYLLAEIEDRAESMTDTLRRVIESTGLEYAEVMPPSKIANTMLAQGGPYIDAANVSDASTAFFRHANRVGLAVDELKTLEDVFLSVPLSSPLTGLRKQTSGFGIRRDPINGRLTPHFGLDFSAAWASPVTATAGGVVKLAGVKSGFGRTVEIDHGNGFITRYAHLHRITVRVGQKVQIHDKIGELGNSGRSTGPHVHYEIHFNGKQKNPRRFIEAGRYVFES